MSWVTKARDRAHKQKTTQSQARFAHNEPAILLFPEMRLSAAVVSTVRIKYTLLYYGIDIGKYHILLKQRRVAGETGLMKALRGEERTPSRTSVWVVFALKQFIKTGLVEVFVENLTAFEACHALSGCEQEKWGREQSLCSW